MHRFVVDSGDGGAVMNGCSACCCEAGTVRPGETDKIILNYAPWVAPIGGKGLVCGTAFVSELIKTCETMPGANTPPSNTNYVWEIGHNTTLADVVTTNATDADVGDVLAYAHVPLYGPANGTLTFNADGSFSYTPRLGFVGHDWFVFETTDQLNTPVRNMVQIAVNPPSGPSLPQKPFPPMLYVDPATVKITNNATALEFALAVSPLARVGDIYRMTILQPAMDCESTFKRQFCIDWTIGKC